MGTVSFRAESTKPGDANRHVLDESFAVICGWPGWGKEGTAWKAAVPVGGGAYTAYIRT